MVACPSSVLAESDRCTAKTMAAQFRSFLVRTCFFPFPQSSTTMSSSKDEEPKKTELPKEVIEALEEDDEFEEFESEHWSKDLVQTEAPQQQWMDNWDDDLDDDFTKNLRAELSKHS